MRKKYLKTCSKDFIYKTHTVKTFDNEIYVNAWNGDFISRNDPKKTVAAKDLYFLAKNLERDGMIVASRKNEIEPLRFLEKPVKIKQYI
ncbi:hypothetical protein [Enterococcus faecalis]|uniref:hypothetical protein n=1 Tax=Enterococcus faecalis TaxID=1351 RepID=UPI00032FE03D|nr:hypothetical protein [Enterococcus faecalis]EOK35913.1 hypothetical protein WUI_03174 [Enterococcus faecalis EnGen0335]EOL91584.1 hypothetical protein WM1_03112 [Enterococcus faecalis EnGen0341]